MARLTLISGQGEGKRLKPIEVSSFLYDFALQDVEAMKKRGVELKAEVQAMQGQPVILRFFKAITDGDYRNAGSLDLALQTREQWVKSSFRTCIQLMKYVPLADIPVATASNLLFAAPRLGLDLTPHLDSLILPVLRKKLKYLHIEGVAEALWGLVVLGVKDTGLILQLVRAAKGRKFLSEGEQAVPHWLNFNKYQPSTEPVTGRQLSLLQETLKKLSQSSDPVLKTEAAAELTARTT